MYGNVQYKEMENITMKKIVALVLVAIMLTAVLASCGKLSGTYSAEILGTGAELEFKGSKVIITPKVLGSRQDPIECKYTIKDDTITITPLKDGEKTEYDGTSDFEKGEDYIKIGILTFNKVD